MPCTAKKAEAARPEMNASGYRDVDIVITTRELGRMIREAGLDFKHLPEDSYDSPLAPVLAQPLSLVLPAVLWKLLCVR